MIEAVTVEVVASVCASLIKLHLEALEENAKLRAELRQLRAENRKLRATQARKGAADV